MTSTFRTRRFSTFGSRLLAAMLAIVAVVAPASADTITVADMLRGISKTREQCSATPQAVWVNAMGRSFCMRYYLAPGAVEQRRVIVFLQGDRLGVLNLRTGAFSVPSGEKDVNTDDLMRFATVLARENKTTAIYLGRVGVEGSSGDHRVRHSNLELQATNAALDAIKQQHKFEGFHLLGQSGGAHLVAGILGLRQDIGCAVIGSGPLAPRRRPNTLDPALDHFNPLHNLEPIARNSGARIMVVTDPADKKVSEDKQTAFVRALQGAGRAVEQYFVQAIDDNRHGVVSYSRVAMLGCLRKASAQEITQQIDRVVKARLVAAARAKAERRPEAGRDAPVPSGEGHGHESYGVPEQSAPAPQRAPDITHQ